MYQQPMQQYGQQQPQQQPQLQHIAGVCFNAVDQGTFNPNLPNQNDAIPQLQASPWLQNQQAQQMLSQSIGIFRLRLQERAMRSPLHSWAYNQISMNRFQNQTWNEWCNRLAGFLEYISVVPSQAQQNPPNVAVPKAADTMFKCYLASCVAQQPQLFQFVQQDQNMVAELQKFGQLAGVILQDITAYRNNRMASQQPQQQIPYAQQPYQQQQPQYGNPQYAQQTPLQSLAAAPQGAFALTPLPLTGATPAGNTGMDYSVPSNDPAPKPISVLAEPTKPLNPVETYGVSVAPVDTVAPVFNMQELDRPVPLVAADVIMDPHYCEVEGFTVDNDRPFDIIHSPGGVITRPAYQVKDWKVTRNDSFVYTQLIDPQRFIRFYTKWPDGMVQESILEVTPMMDYLRHEINADLLRDAHRPDGVVATTKLKIYKEISDIKPIDEVKELMLSDEHQPVRLRGDFQGTTDMENEVEVRKVLRQELKLDKDATLPAHEYLSTRTHLIDIDDSDFEELMQTLDSNDLAAVAKDLRLHYNKGILSSRTFNFINDRLTKEVNTFLNDAMSQTVRMDDFSLDVIPLMDYLASVDGKYVTMLKEATSLILAHSVQLHRSEDDSDNTVTYSINDSFVNLQTGWNLRELTDMTLNSEAQLVSACTHQALIDTIKSMLGRATAAERILHRFRLVTLDGAYLEIFKGVLVQNAYMFKRVA